MRRLARHLFTFCSAALLVLCVAVCVLWARSYGVSQFVGWSDADRFVGALSMGGLVRLEHGTYGPGELGWSYLTYPTPGGTLPGLWSEVAARDRRGGPLRAAGIAYARVDYVSDVTGVRRALYLPHWLIALPLLVLPTAWARRAYIRRRHRPGHCRTCGYDLRASPERCPECGAVSAPAEGTL